jgi:plastocyanin
VMTGALGRWSGILVIASALSPVPASRAAETHQVVMTGVAFEPRQLTLHVGDTIEWLNQDIVAHTATARDKSWDVNVLPGRSGRMVMRSTGTFSYLCRYHPNMVAEVTVEP